MYPLQLCECVCLCAAPLPSDPHECVYEVYVLGVVSCVCVRYVVVKDCSDMCVCVCTFAQGA